MRTCAPITAYGPMLTDAASSAFASTMAVGWTCAIGSGHLAHRAHQLGLGSEFLADQRAALELEDAGLHALDRHVEDQLVARLHRPLEARAIDAGEVVDGVVVEVYAHDLEREQRRSLRQCLEHQYARHHRALGEVSGEERFVHRHVL